MGLFLLIALAVAAAALLPPAAEARRGKCPVGRGICWPTRVHQVRPSGSAIHRIDYQGQVILRRAEDIASPVEFHAETRWSWEHYRPRGYPRGAFDVHVPVRRWPPLRGMRKDFERGQRVPATLHVESTVTGAFDNYDYEGNYLGRVPFTCRVQGEVRHIEQTRLRIKGRGSRGWLLAYNVLRDLFVRNADVDSSKEECDTSDDDVYGVASLLLEVATESGEPLSRGQGAPFIREVEEVFPLSDRRLRRPGRFTARFRSGLPPSASDCRYIGAGWDEYLTVESCGQSLDLRGKLRLRNLPYCGEQRALLVDPDHRDGPVSLLTYGYPGSFRGKDCH